MATLTLHHEWSDFS